LEVLGEVVASSSANSFRQIYGNYGLIHRNDGSSYWILSTASGDQYGTWNSFRPFTHNFADGTVSIANSLIVKNAANVGIGTTSPEARLQVMGTGLFGNTGASTNGGVLQVYTGNIVNANSGIDITRGVYPTVSGALSLRLVSDSGGTYRGVIGFGATSGAESITIIGGGNVGIGNTSPVNKLDIEGAVAIGATYSGASTAPTNGLIVEGNVGIGTTSPVTKLDIIGNIRSSSSVTDATAKDTSYSVRHYTNAEESFLVFYAYAGAASNSLAIGGSSGGHNAATGIKFYTAANNTTTAGTERVHIDYAGNVGIGVTSPVNKLDIEGAVAIGATYSGTSTAPTNGLIVEGNVGIGITTLDAKLHVLHSGVTAHFVSGNGGNEQCLVLDGDQDAGDNLIKARANASGGASCSDSDIVFVLTGGGQVGIRQSSPTAYLHLPACTAAANTASLKIPAGTVATTPVSGNIESDGTHLYWTDSGGTRRQLDN
jgi:hypothetical protein